MTINEYLQQRKEQFNRDLIESEERKQQLINEKPYEWESQLRSAENMIDDRKESLTTIDYLFEIAKKTNDEIVGILKKEIRTNNGLMKLTQLDYDYTNRELYRIQKAEYRKYFFNNVLYKDVLKIIKEQEN